jgi:hypothetical protein
VKHCRRRCLPDIVADIGRLACGGKAGLTITLRFARKPAVAQSAVCASPLRRKRATPSATAAPSCKRCSPLRDLANIAHEIDQAGAHLKVLEQGVDTSSAAGRAFFGMSAPHLHCVVKRTSHSCRYALLVRARRPTAPRGPAALQPERHVPNSIATMRQGLIAELVATL